ncbi:glycoside hydrolase family 15 protein [Lichenicola sp.]|uniref:glycoside hydrolase family 15 protein n=1 Tax=Lichenicola sp. TaxID=2804529 RepID=UPI003B00C40C
MYNQISDYGLIGDTHSTALIDRDGSIDWLCWPRHDSPALFLRLLDDTRGGSCRIELDRRMARSRRYLPDTNILETRFACETGVGVLTDLMPVHPPDTLPEEGPDGENESRLIRLLVCESGSISGSFVIRPTFDYARIYCSAAIDGDSVLFEAGPDRLRAGGSLTPEIDGRQARMAFRLQAGERAILVLTHGHDERPPLAKVDHALERLEQTRRYWEQWSARCTYQGPYRDAVVRSALCLKLLTYSPTGAIVAAPTTSLPEAVPGNRNFDYRFTWLRDASFTVSSFARLGYTREAAEFLRFLRDAEPNRGRTLKLMYSIDGEMPEETTLDHLEGWRGVGPVRIGNAASGQTQSDIYGELLAALHDFLNAVDFDPPQKVNDHLPEVLPNLVDAALALRNRPDQGIWEMRDGKQVVLHSQAMIWVAVSCAAAMARRIGTFDAAMIAAWERTAEELKAEFLERGWNDQRQAYTMGYGKHALDASVLRLVVFGAIDPHDPRLHSTMAAIERELGDGDLLYRYRTEDGLEGDEATFTACAFWRVGVLALGGRTRDATDLFERLLGRGNDLGLYAEEIDAATGEQRGNFPQAFTHMAVINNALRLQGTIADFGLPDAA